MNLQPWIEKSKECITILEKINKQEYSTKKEYIQKFIDAERVLVKEGYHQGITIDKLASFINTKLALNGITYHKNGEYYSWFSDEEKRSGGYGTNFDSLDSDSHEHDFKATDSPLLKTCICGRILFKGLEYDVAPITEESDEIIEQRAKNIKEKSDPTKYPETLYFYLVQENGGLLAKLSRALWVKFFDKEDPKKKSNKAEIIEKSLRNVKDKIEEQKEIKAELLYLLKISDERQKIGSFEKLKGLLLAETTYNPSHVANMMGITDKHFSNIIKAKSKEIMDDYKDGWFSNIHLECHVSSCGNFNTYSIGEWVDESLIRKKIGLTLKQPFSD